MALTPTRRVSELDDWLKPEPESNTTNDHEMSPGPTIGRKLPRYRDDGQNPVPQSVNQFGHSGQDSGFAVEAQGPTDVNETSVDPTTLAICAKSKSASKQLRLRRHPKMVEPKD